MSKDILVNKGDTLTVIRDISKLVTNLSNGGMATWIPEDETLLVTKTIIKDGTYEASREPTKPYGYSQVTVTGVGNKIMGDLGEKSITKNGVYIAKQDKDGPFYGYSKLYVNVPGGDDGSGGGGDGGSSSPTITGKDEDGDDAIVGTDEDGKIVTSKLPTRISINVYPNNLVYEDGQTIDYTGLRVKAFLPDDTEWGIVDDGQLIKPVTVAEAEGISPFSSFTKTLDGKSVQVASSMKTTQYYRTVDLNGYARSVVASCGGGCIILYSARSYYAVSYSNDSIVNWQNSEDGSYIYRPSERGLSGTVVTSNVLGNGKITNRKIYYCYAPGNEYANNVYEWITFREPDLESSGYSTLTSADIALGGIGEEPSSQQTILLQWKRPGDKKVLETSFTIAVHEN